MKSSSIASTRRSSAKTGSSSRTFANHRLGCLTLEEELPDLLGLTAADAVEEHVVRIRRAFASGGSHLRGRAETRAAPTPCGKAPDAALETFPQPRLRP
jgi:hypothetical protein